MNIYLQEYNKPEAFDDDGIRDVTPEEWRLGQSYDLLRKMVIWEANKRGLAPIYIYENQSQRELPVEFRDEYGSIKLCPRIREILTFGDLRKLEETIENYDQFVNWIQEMFGEVDEHRKETQGYKETQRDIESL